MTAKELLRERIESLTEEQAGRALDLIESEFEADRPLSEEEIAHIKRGLADLDAGRKVPHDEVLRRYGLTP